MRFICLGIKKEKNVPGTIQFLDGIWRFFLFLILSNFLQLLTLINDILMMS